MTREQTFVVTGVTKYKDGCGEVVPAYNGGDIRMALLKGLPTYESVSVLERADMETMKGE